VEVSDEEWEEELNENFRSAGLYPGTADYFYYFRSAGLYPGTADYFLLL
jgi:hypothetical protein